MTFEDEVFGRLWFALGCGHEINDEILVFKVDKNLCPKSCPVLLPVRNGKLSENRTGNPLEAELGAAWFWTF